MAPNRKIYALKRIKLQGRDAEAATGFIDEITLLQALKGKPNIIQLIDAEVRSLPNQSPAARGHAGHIQLIDAEVHPEVSTHRVLLVPTRNPLLMGAGLFC